MKGRCSRNQIGLTLLKLMFSALEQRYLNFFKLCVLLLNYEFNLGFFECLGCLNAGQATNMFAISPSTLEFVIFRLCFKSFRFSQPSS